MGICELMYALQWHVIQHEQQFEKMLASRVSETSMLGIPLP